jgi:hypothetical protein
MSGVPLKGSTPYPKLERVHTYSKGNALPKVFGFFGVLVCNAATQLALELHQKHLHVVSLNLERFWFWFLFWFWFWFLFKNGHEPLEKKINKILGLKREDRFLTPFF